MKLWLHAGYHHQALGLAAHPQVALPVFGDGAYLGCVEVEVAGEALYALQLVAAFFQQEQAITPCTYIYIFVVVFEYLVYYNVCATLA